MCEHRARQTGRHSKTEEQLFTFRDGYTDKGGHRFWKCQKSLDRGYRDRWHVKARKTLKRQNAASDLIKSVPEPIKHKSSC